MIPAWVITFLVVVGGVIGAMWLGATLSNDPIGYGVLFLLAVACVLCAASNSFPFLIALALVTPYTPPLPGGMQFPAMGLVAVWMTCILFFRLCLRGYLPYRRSFPWLALIIFAWVPIRFLMSPVHKLGARAGGVGVSGAMPYFLYLLAPFVLVLLGAVLKDRSEVLSFLRWAMRFSFIIGNVLLACVFIPATAPFLSTFLYTPGEITEGIQRIVVLPAYGLFLLQAALCPALFRLKPLESILLLVNGLAMIVVGGNRSALATAVLAVPVIFLLRKQRLSLAVTLCLMFAGVGCLKIYLHNLPLQEIPGYMRSFGFIDSRIDKASDGALSAEWRYSVWQAGIDKIKEKPLVGNGFGNLPQHLDSGDPSNFEAVVAGGMAHNGYIDAAYGFGIPFAVGLCLVLLWFLFKESIQALTTDKHDPELRDIHAFVASMLAIYPILIYSAADLSTTPMWIYIGVSCILSRLPRSDGRPISEVGAPTGRYGNEGEARTPALYPYRQY